MDPLNLHCFSNHDSLNDIEGAGKIKKKEKNFTTYFDRVLELEKADGDIIHSYLEAADKAQ